MTHQNDMPVFCDVSTEEQVSDQLKSLLFSLLILKSKLIIPFNNKTLYYIDRGAARAIQIEERQIER
jgi:hypothetical protein